MMRQYAIRLIVAIIAIALLLSALVAQLQAR
jgi:hypothetical protein